MADENLRRWYPSSGPIISKAEQLLPLEWREPATVIVSDIFAGAPLNYRLDQIFAVMWTASHHTFRVATEYPERARAHITTTGRRMLFQHAVRNERRSLDPKFRGDSPPIALPNVWLGCPVVDQKTADARIPYLLLTPAAKRFISIESPAPVDLTSLRPKPQAQMWGFTLVNALTGEHRLDDGATLNNGRAPDAVPLDFIIDRDQVFGVNALTGMPEVAG